MVSLDATCRCPSQEATHPVAVSSETKEGFDSAHITQGVVGPVQG